MARPKEQLPISELFTNSILNYSFEDRVWLMEALIENVKGEAALQKEQGEKASQILNKLENGK